MRNPSAPKFLLYSHDSFGLGNIRRTLLLAETLTRAYPRGAILIVTGSPVIHSFRIPDGVDYVKLPSLDRVDAERYEPRFLQSWSQEVHRTRAAMLRQAIVSFDPDLIIVDKRPGGIGGELLESLRVVRQAERRPKLVLGMRDILDSRERTRNSLKDHGCFDTLRRFYDEVWIYGSQDVFDATVEYGFPDDIRARTKFTGYLGRPAPSLPRKEGPPRVVVATGGGGDGSEMIGCYLKGLLTLPRGLVFRTTVVLGPEMPRVKRDQLVQGYAHLADVDFCDFDPDPTERYAQADVVVSMAGYNTVCEMLSVERPVIVVPRTEPVLEQLIRARCLSERGALEMIEPKELSPSVLIERVVKALDGPAPPRWSPRLDGLATVRDRVATLLGACA